MLLLLANHEDGCVQYNPRMRNLAKNRYTSDASRTGIALPTKWPTRIYCNEYFDAFSQINLGNQFVFFIIARYSKLTPAMPRPKLTPAPVCKIPDGQDTSLGAVL